MAKTKEPWIREMKEVFIQFPGEVREHKVSAQYFFDEDGVLIYTGTIRAYNGSEGVVREQMDRPDFNERVNQLIKKAVGNV